LVSSTALAFALAYAGLAVFLGGILRGYTGFGFAIAATPLLTLVLPPTEAVAIVAMLQVAIGLTDLRGAVPRADWRGITPLMIGMALATPLGFALLLVMSAAQARLAIALTLAVATASLMAGWRFRDRPASMVAVAIGLVSGLFNGLAAMPGPPVVAYCLGLALPAAQTRATLIVYFMLTSLLALGAAIASGLIGWPEVAAAAIAFPLLFAGGAVGARLFHRHGATAYRRHAIMALAGLTLIVAARAVYDLTWS
jgi:uncharacterized protein